MSIANSRPLERRPTHPGEILREDFLAEYGLSVTALAEALGVSRQSVDVPVSARAAVRVVIGDRDPMVPLHATFEARLAALALPHLLVKVPGVGHEALPLMRGMGDAHWAYNRTALGVP